MMADTPPETGWVYDGEVWCANCVGVAVDATLYEGSSDTPTHCGGCGVPISHELTADGVEYVRASLADGNGCCDAVWRTVWEEYDVEPKATKIPINSIPIPKRFVTVCSEWYGGQACMLYAVSSCKGRFTTGTLRPRGCDTSEKWYLSIWRDLASDADYTLTQSQKPDCASPDDLTVLGEFVDWVDYQVSRLERSYGLADWDACDD